MSGNKVGLEQISSRISPASANDQAPLLVLGSRRGCQLCPILSEELALENYQPCAPCVPTGSFLQLSCRPFNTQAMRPDDT